jgi:hypothetical protein
MLGRYRSKWVDIMEMGFKGTDCEGVDWCNFTRDRGQWQAVINTVMNIRVTKKAGNF